MKPFRFALVGLMLLGLAAVAAAAGREAPFHFKIYRAGLPTIEIMVEAGESAELRNQRTGEALELVPRKAEGREAAEIEIFRRAAERQSVETVELHVGEKVSTRKLETPLEIELLSGPIEGETSSTSGQAEGLFEVELELPSGKTLMAVADIASGELIRIESPELGGALGFRAAITRLANPVRIEAFTATRDGAAQPLYRFVKSLPLGSSAGFAAADLPALQAMNGTVRVIVRPADPAMWDNTAMAGGLDGVVELRARWAGARWITGKAYGGEMFRIAHPSLGGEIGFAPVSTEGEAVTLNVFRIRHVAGAGESLELADTVVARPGASSLVAALDGLAEVELVERRPPLVRGRCWLGCGAGSGHGCAVSCGDDSCCTGGCCAY